MFDNAILIFDKMDIAICAAAIADYTPINVADKKIKKKDDGMILELKKTPDTLAALGKMKSEGQTLVGFALETNNEIENAQLKLENKNADFIVLNSTKNKNSTFGFDTNQITIVEKNKITGFQLKPKTIVATDILNRLVENYL